MAVESARKLISVAIKGLAMGAADVIPGVSGGTIAFITGIYEELLETIANLNFALLKTWRKEGFRVMWTKGNFSFLFALFSGIAISIMSLAMLIEHLLKNYPIQLWSFFFGLILASVWLVGRTVVKWSFGTIFGLLAGTAAAWYITVMSPSTGSDNLFYIFVCGAIAVCAMILPGISGSFILLLLGAYTTVLGSITSILHAVKNSDWGAVTQNGLLIVVFLVGCIAGLISFSKVLNWLFKKAHSLTVAILTGFLIGSLNKIWPWKETLETFIKHKGEHDEEIVPLVQRNILPNHYETVSHQSSELAMAVILMVVGLGVILLIDYLGRRDETN